MINKINNFNQFIYENYNDFNSVFNTIKTYIYFTLNSKVQINEYVPNTHIAETFKEVLQACEKESMYPEIYHNIPYEEWENKVGTYSISFLDKIKDYFDLERLNKNGNDEIHMVYQKLREKNDYIRQSLKLIDTIIPNEYNMQHKLKKDLESDKIIIK